jgi:hypothetical protein
MFRTVTASTYWKTGTVTRPPVVNLDGLPVMVDLTDPEGRTWPVAVNNILQTGWESEAA